MKLISAVFHYKTLIYKIDKVLHSTSLKLLVISLPKMYAKVSFLVMLSIASAYSRPAVLENILGSVMNDTDKAASSITNMVGSTAIDMAAGFANGVTGNEAKEAVDGLADMGKIALDSVTGTGNGNEVPKLKSSAQEAEDDFPFFNDETTDNIQSPKGFSIFNSAGGPFMILANLGKAAIDKLSGYGSGSGGALQMFTNLGQAALNRLHSLFGGRSQAYEVANTGNGPNSASSIFATAAGTANTLAQGVIGLIHDAAGRIRGPSPTGKRKLEYLAFIHDILTLLTGLGFAKKCNVFLKIWPKI